MLDITTDIQSLTTFRRYSGAFLRQLKKSKRPVALTVNGRAAAVVQDAEAYQRLLDLAARADAREASGKDWRTLGREEVGQRGNSSPSLKARMTYLVNITQRARRDLADLYDRIHAESSLAAGTWYQGLKAAILSLEPQPNRCPVIRKQQKLRHLL